jgi:hypothetical protein
MEDNAHKIPITTKNHPIWKQAKEALGVPWKNKIK